MLCLTLSAVFDSGLLILALIHYVHYYSDTLYNNQESV